VTDLKLITASEMETAAPETDEEIRVATVLKGRSLEAFQFLLNKGGIKGVDALKDSKKSADYLRRLIINYAEALGFGD